MIKALAKSLGTVVGLLAGSTALYAGLQTYPYITSAVVLVLLVSVFCYVYYTPKRSK